MLAPTAGEAVPTGYPGQDYGRLLDVTKTCGVGTIGVRILAGGALSGSEKRHPLGNSIVKPIGSNDSYAEDVICALRFQTLIYEGHAGSLPELAVRYVVSNPALATVEIGIATIDELQRATAAVEKGPLPKVTLAEIQAIQGSFVNAVTE